jgi:hypothetical protein
VAVPEIPDTVRDKAAWVDLQELDQHGEGLTQWEIDFVESLTKRLRDGNMLTDAQRGTLAKIREDRL